ncbi:MAG: hypothetical protein IJL73_09775, partial [Lachnospiraceae bacterium]|nr:hypothetical protein [Lachnospiraceae bacterium]
MKKLFSCILAFVLAAGLLSCMPESYTISDTGKTDAPVTQEPGSKDPGDPATMPVVTDPPTQEPVTQDNPEESTAPSKSAETSAPYSDPDQGVLKDLGIWPDAASLPNNSIPYGNDWEDRDQYGIANGIHWYEAKFGKYGAVYRINTTEKLLYLTMDEGYEAGHT